MVAENRLCLVVALALSVACDQGSAAGTGNGPSAAWTPGVFPPSASFANQCTVPRTGIDPTTGRAYPDRPGSRLLENQWLRSWTHELYLWYREVPDLDPGAYSTADYFDRLKTPATTPSGNPKDKFHFTYPTPQWVALSQSGIEAGYGARWVIVASRPPRRVVVAYTEPGSPAVAAGLTRGAQVLTVDGADLVNGNDNATINALNAGLFPSEPGTTHTFTVLDRDAAAPRTVTLTATNVTSTPVQNVRRIGPGGRVGYILFNDHIATSEGPLIAAFSQLSGVSDLVLDIRYNGGGYLDIASEVAYMIAGAGPTAGQTFERTMFNDKYPNTNPVTGGRLTPVPFHDTAQGFSAPDRQPLPTLNLSRVFVLTSDDTCSASESIMNGLRGVGIPVIQVGGTTCGKPYGFYPEDNCGTTYFSIEFQGVNAQGFGDYPDGFSPANAVSRAGVAIPGCAVADDFSRDLGDPNEGRLQAALGYILDGRCPSPTADVTASIRDLSTAGALAHRSPWRENRILRRR